MSKSIKVAPSTLLRYAKTKMTIKDTPSVINAKFFSDLTPTKQTIVIESYKKQLKKQKKKKEKKDVYKPLDIGKYKPPGVPEKYYSVAQNYDTNDLGFYSVNSYKFKVDEGGGEEGDEFFSHPSFDKERGEHEEIINWGIKSGIIKYRPSDELLAEKEQLEERLKIPIGSEWEGHKWSDWHKESAREKLKRVNLNIEWHKKQFLKIAGVTNKSELQSVLNTIKSVVMLRITEANKRIREVEKKRAGTISAKGLIGGIGVVKQPEKVDTSEGGAGMGKSISITEGKQFREQFKGGAKIGWLEHVKNFREANPEMSYKDALKEAKKTYNPMRKRERVQQILDTAERKKSFVKKERKLTKKQVALRFSGWDKETNTTTELLDKGGEYDEEYEKVWDTYIKGKRFKDNRELLLEFRNHWSGKMFKGWSML